MIKVYGSDSCIPCEELKDHLKIKGIEFELIDIEKPENEEKVKYIVKKTGEINIPIIEDGEKFMVGYNKEKLEEFLKDGMD